jgi:hypothetical protein
MKLSKTMKEFVHELRIGVSVVVGENRRVSVKEILTDEERTSVASEMANLVQEVESKEDDLKNVTNQMKTEIKTLQGRVSLDANLLNTGYRMIVKPCAVIADFERRMRLFLDPETGEQVGKEPLQENDYQIRANLGELRN